VQTVSTKTIASSNGAPNKYGKVPLVGVLVQDQIPVNAIKLPVGMSVKPGLIGGPSAGLMFTLGLVEELEHRDYTRGCKIAGTGTVDLQGNVGVIGGARQKVVAAERAGARYFLVPDVAENRKPAEGARDGVAVVPVKTVRQALTFLRQIAPCHT
jgi:PDZ domain-containing protein